MQRTRDHGPSKRAARPTVQRRTVPTTDRGPEGTTRSPELVKLQSLAGNAAVTSLVAQRQPGKGDDDTSSLRITTASIDDAIMIMWKTYQILLRKRRDAVDRLAVLVREDENDPPSIIVGLLLGMAASGILGPTGMIGAAIASSMIDIEPSKSKYKRKKNPTTTAKVVNGAIANTLNTGISDGLKAIYGAATESKQKSKADARTLFFLTQRTWLSDQADKVEIHFLNHANEFRQLEQDEKGSGVAALRALQESVLKNVAKAEQTQQDESLKAWLNYEANEALGTHEPSKKFWFAGKGADLSKIMGTGRPGGRPKPTPGVLSLKFTPILDYPSRTVIVDSARIEGLNKAMRKRLETIPIGELGIPIVGWSTPWGSDGFLTIGVNEANAPWYSIKDSIAPRSALMYLYGKVNPGEYAKLRTKEDFDRITQAQLVDAAPWGALTILREISHLKLGDAKIAVED